MKTKDELKGNRDLYNQHCKLFQIKNEIQDIVNGDMNFEGFKKDDEITYLIHRFQDYSQYHFEYEHKHNKDIGASTNKQHKTEHKSFIQSISSLEKKSYSNENLRDITNFLSSWIDDHVNQ